MAIPMQIIAIERGVAVCEARGARRQVSLFLLDPDTVAPGTHVAVDRGFAIEVISAARAAEAWAVMDQMVAAIDRLADAPFTSAPGPVPAP